MRITVKFWGKGECATYTLQSYSLGRPEGGICEQFVHLSNLVVYQNSSDIKNCAKAPLIFIRRVNHY